MMRMLLCAVMLMLPASVHPAWWAENDYALGSGSFQRESLSVFTRVSPALMGGANASFYKDRDHDLKKAYAFRIPVMYSMRNLVLSMKPFIYPASSGTGSSARGAKLYALFPLQEETDESRLHLTLSGAAAHQKTPLLSPSAAAGPETFSETAFEAQVEKIYYKQFFFQISAAGFSKAGTSRNSNPARKPGPDSINPVMDHGELAHMGTFRQVTALPKWTAAAQFARNMAPDYDSYLYAGFSRISFRSAGDANSILGGIKFNPNGYSTFDFAYNFYKTNGETGENYYRLLIQVFFR
jgi:hypothetical protein